MADYDPKTFRYRSGLSSVGAYQVSGVPYLSASNAVIPANSAAPYQVTFPYVTNWIVVENMGGHALRLAFSAHGAKGVGFGGDEKNYFVLAPSSSVDQGHSALRRVKLDVRVKDIFLLSDTSTATSAQVMSGLTLISTDELTATLPNWSGSSGVG